MAKQLLNQGMVLEFLKKGKTVQEISKETGAKPNAIYTAIQRLKNKKLWPIDGLKTEIKLEPKVKSKKTREVSAESIVDEMFKRVNKSLDMEAKIKELEKNNYELTNKLAATSNELAIALEELGTKREAAERIRKVAARLSNEHQRLSEEAQK